MASRLIVVKVGTSGITTPNGMLDEEEMQQLAKQISFANKRGDRMVLVTSGAVASGIAELGISPKPNDLVFQQASAATGQSVLMAKYREYFREYDVKVAQILLTAEDLSNRASYLHTCNVLEMLLKIGVVPIINENDVTSVEELKPVTKGYRVNFSDNDILSALVANALRADLVIILSDVDGLFTKNPQDPSAELIETVECVTCELKEAINGKSRFGRGGIQSKVKAAEIATTCGIPVVIANSRRANVITDILTGKQIGTYFKAQPRLPAVKSWIAYGAAVKGRIIVNAGAKKAILDGGSLLPVGITDVVGIFSAGDVVGVVGEDGVEFAKGNPNYDSGELQNIKGLQASQVKKQLGTKKPKEVIERRNIHLIEGKKMSILEICKKARKASVILAQLNAEAKDVALCRMANSLQANADKIISANEEDVQFAKKRGMKAAMLDRLALSEKKIENMANCIREVSALPDPVGEIVKTWTRPNGLLIGIMRVPLGVIGVIYESRPDVTSDSSAICIKSGNAVILRGGSDAINSNVTIGGVLRDSLSGTGVPEDAIQVIASTDRGAAEEFMGMRGYVDVLVPRGGSDLIHTVLEKAKVPVIETGLGNCHIYVEEDADLDEAVPIIVNAKCQRPGTCNAVEKLLVHNNIAGKFLPIAVAALRKGGVEIRGDEKVVKIVSDAKLATEQDWYTEYSDFIIGVKVVQNLNEAIAHINKYGTKHSDSILTADFKKAMRFIREVDSAAVYWNASTRFTDGNQFGLGAEIGISTQKLHARGPMSVQHLTSTKYFVLGSGQIRK